MTSKANALWRLMRFDRPIGILLLLWPTLWALVIAGFSPIPFKLFTVSAGALSMPFGWFVLAAILGRSAHFYLIGMTMAWAGPKMEPTVRRYIEWLGWLTVAVAVIAYVWHQNQ